MPNEPIIGELQRKLDEAEWLSDEDRAKLTRMLGQFRYASAKMEGHPTIGPEEAAQERENMRVRWLDVLEACRKLDEAEGELLVKQADQADARRNRTLVLLRIVHARKDSLEDGTFTGTEEERETLSAMVEEVEETGDILLETLTAEDIRQLEDDGVL